MTSIAWNHHCADRPIRPILFCPTCTQSIRLSIQLAQLFQDTASRFFTNSKQACYGFCGIAVKNQTQRWVPAVFQNCTQMRSASPTVKADLAAAMFPTCHYVSQYHMYHQRIDESGFLVFPPGVPQRRIYLKSTDLDLATGSSRSSLNLSVSQCVCLVCL